MKLFLSAIIVFMTSLGAAMHAGDISTTTQNIVILLGPPGSGKGTQAVKLTQELHIPHISTGDLFRDNIKGNTELGIRAKTFMDAGKLVPDEVVLDMLFDRISHPDCEKGFLLDGFPRTIPQAEAFEAYVVKAHARVIAFNLEVPDAVIVERAAGRLTCKSCGNVHNKSFSPPAVEGACDKCGGELIQRTDDKPEVVLERLKVYHEQTKPLIQYYKTKKVLDSFDGTKSPSAIFADLLRVYNERVSTPFIKASNN